MSTSLRQRLSLLKHRWVHPRSQSSEEFTARVEAAECPWDVHMALATLERHLRIPMCAYLAEQGTQWDRRLLEVVCAEAPGALATLAKNGHIRGEEADWVLEQLAAPCQVLHHRLNTARRGRRVPRYRATPLQAAEIVRLLTQRGEVRPSHPVLVELWSEVESAPNDHLGLLRALLEHPNAALERVRTVADRSAGEANRAALAYLVLRGEESDVRLRSYELAVHHAWEMGAILSEMSAERRGWIPKSTWLLLLSSPNEGVRLAAARHFRPVNVPGGERRREEHTIRVAAVAAPRRAGSRVRR